MSYRRGELAVLNQNKQEQEKKAEPNWRLSKWFPDLDKGLLEQFKFLQTELFKFNTTLNLISDTTVLNADELHFADSIYAAQIVLQGTEAKEIYDIGSGNGFPGLILALLAPERSFILLDKDERKVEYLKVMIGRLNLSNCTARHGLLEQVEEGSIQCAVSRAFAPLGNALIMGRKAFAVGGEYFHLKNESWGAEVRSMPVQVISHWDSQLVGEYKLPSSNKNHFIVKTIKE